MSSTTPINTPYAVLELGDGHFVVARRYLREDGIPVYRLVPGTADWSYRTVHFRASGLAQQSAVREEVAK
jgi:hypothetical protein